MFFLQTARNLGVVLLVMPAFFSSLLALKCYGKTNDTFTRKCATFCSELNCPSYCICVNDSTENNACSPMPTIPNNAIQVKETVTPGTTIMSINGSGSDKWELALQRSGVVDGSIWNDLSSYFKLNKIGNLYEIIVDQTPDLEDIFYRFSIKLKELTLILTCKRAAYSDEIHQIKLEILPVNEFAPEYREAILIQNVTEDTKVGSVVLMLVNQTMDLDVNPYGRELGAFSMADYLLDTKHDGKEYFEMKDFLLGSIVLLKLLDYEALKPLDATRFYLNVSASDIHGLTTYTTLTINILDVDDLPPEFYFSGCPAVTIKVIPCHVSYEAVLPLNYVGWMTEILPSFIHARDMDTLNAPLEFSLELAPGEKIANLLHFTINKTSGEITVIAPFLQATEVRLVVVVREVSFMSKSTQASFHVLVDNSSLVLMPLKKMGYPELSLDPADQSDEGRIYAIIFLVAVSVVVATLSALVVYLCIRVKKLNSVTPAVNPQQANDADYKRPLNSDADDSRDGGGDEQDASLKLSETANSQIVPPTNSALSNNLINIKDKSGHEENSQLMKGLGQMSAMQPERFQLERVDLGVGNVNKSCFNDNDSSTAIVTYYFNDRQGAELQQSHNRVGAHCVVPIEHEELWGGRIASRDRKEGTCERIRVNSANIVLDMDLPRVNSLRRISQHMKKEHDSGMRSGSIYSESSTSVCSSSSNSSTEQCRSPGRLLTYIPYTPQFEYIRSVNKYSGTHCINTENRTKHLRHSNCVQAENSQQTSPSETSSNQSLATDTNNVQTHSGSQCEAKTCSMSQNTTAAQILSIMPLDQRSFICVSDDSCHQDASLKKPYISSHPKLESPRQRHGSKLQKANVSSPLKLESPRQVHESKQQRPSSLLVKSTSSRLMHEGRLQRPSSSYPRSTFPRRRHDSFSRSSDTPKILYVRNDKCSAPAHVDYSKRMNTGPENYDGYQIQIENCKHAEQIPSIENVDFQSPKEQDASQECTNTTHVTHSAKSCQGKTRPHTCPSETHTAENFQVILPNRPWTSEVSTGAHKKTLTGSRGADSLLVPRQVSVTKTTQFPQPSPSSAVHNTTDLRKRSNTSVSYTHVNRRPPRRLNKVKKKRGERHRKPDARFTHGGVNTDEQGDSSQRHTSSKEVRSSLASLRHDKMLGETDHREGFWPPDPDSTSIPKVRRLPSLEQRPAQDFHWPNPLSGQNEQTMAAPSTTFSLESKALLSPAEQAVVKEGDNAMNKVAEGDTG